MIAVEYVAPSDEGMPPVLPDTGCRYHPACLSCPFPACVEEFQGAARIQYLAMLGIDAYAGRRARPSEATAADRAARILELRRDGYSIRWIARDLHMSVRRVREIVHDVRVANGGRELWTAQLALL